MSSSVDAVPSPAPFSLPTVHVNGSSFGPVGLPEELSQLPFAAFNRADRVGKIADFGGFARYVSRRFGRAGEENTELTYRFDADEAKEFSRVEARGKVVSALAATPMPQRFYGGYSDRGGRGGGRGGSSGGRGGYGGGGGAVGGVNSKGYDDRGARSAGRKSSAMGGGGAGGGRGGRDDRYGSRGGYGGRGGFSAGGLRRGPGGAITREPSVNVTADWLLLEQVDFSQLAKLSTAVPVAEDLRWAGSLEAYDEDVDRLTTKTAKRLKTFDQTDFFYHSANEEPVLQELAQEEDAGNVYATDSVLAHIMTCSRSVLPWDIVITYLPGGIIFIDHRDAYKLEALTVSETSHIPPSEDDDETLNSREKLTEEATYLHQMLSQQVSVCVCVCLFVCVCVVCLRRRRQRPRHVSATRQSGKGE